MIHKITYGFVTQKFGEDGNFRGQEFTAGDKVDYEDSYGDTLSSKRQEVADSCYHNFDMVQSPRPGVEVCEFVPVSEVVPEEWREWFWAELSEDAPFSWGDNNRSLVTASDFKQHCRKTFGAIDVSDHGVSQEVVDHFLEVLDDLGTMYLDLES